MSAILIRNIEPNAIKTLKNIATKNGRSLQSELRSILERAAFNAGHDPRRSMLKLRSLFVGKKFSDSTRLVREDRDG